MPDKASILASIEKMRRALTSPPANPEWLSEYLRALPAPPDLTGALRAAHRMTVAPAAPVPEAWQPGPEAPFLPLPPVVAVTGKAR